MREKIAKLVAHPAFRAAPLTVLGRCAGLAAYVAMRHEPVLRLTRHGERLRVPADLRYTSVTAFLLRDGTEPELYRLEQFLRPGDTFLDVGANIGLFVLKAARIVGPSGRVIAAEPGRVSADRLEANLLLNNYKQIQVLREALSDTEGVANLHHIELGHDPQAFSLLEDGSGVAGEAVPTTTLDRLSQRLSLTRLDCVKIDVEGAEPMVIAGGRETLERYRPIVIFEINSPPALHTGQPAAASQALQALGYQLYELCGSTLTPLPEQPLTLGNLVAIHPEGIQPLSFQR